MSWKKSVLLWLVVSFTVECVLFFVVSIMGSRCTFSYPALHWIWVGLFLVIGLVIISKLNIVWGRFFAILFSCGFLSLIFWGLLTRYNPIIVNYIGIQYRYSSEWSLTGRDDHAVYNYPLQFGFLYKADDPDLKSAIKERQSQNDSVNVRGFIFWQTGVAQGFCDRGRPNFYTSKNKFIFNAKLFLTIGPIVVFECLLNGFYRLFFILLIIQFIFYKLKKDDEFWNLFA